MAALPPTRDLVQVERKGPVAFVVLHHPPVNLLSSSLLEELAGRLDEVQQDQTARVVVLASGLERVFSAGANIQEMAPMGPADAVNHSTRGQGITLQIEACPLPVIAAVHGACLGGGCEIVQACDFVLASDDATFGQPEINLGVMPGWGGTQRLPRLVGSQAARAWTMLGNGVSAEEAKAAGLVLRVVPRTSLLESAEKLAEELATKPPLALAAAKYALNFALDRPKERGLALERRLWSRLFGTPDQTEGMAAFLAKRPATFGDRRSWGSLSRGFPWAGPRRPTRTTPGPKGPRRGRTRKN